MYSSVAARQTSVGILEPLRIIDGTQTGGGTTGGAPWQIWSTAGPGLAPASADS